MITKTTNLPTGVTRLKTGAMMFVARRRFMGKLHHLGQYASPLEAVQALEEFSKRMGAKPIRKTANRNPSHADSLAKAREALATAREVRQRNRPPKPEKVVVQRRTRQATVAPKQKPKPIHNHRTTGATPERLAMIKRLAGCMN